jgi:hypothetical protein
LTDLASEASLWKAVMNASLALGDIKSVFHKEASEAKSVKEVENAYKKAGNAA